MNELTEHTEDVRVDDDQRNLQGAIDLAILRFGEALTLRDLAEAAGMPENTLTRKFNREFGMSPIRWLWYFRTILAAEFIAAAPEWPLTDIAVYCGFNSSAHFSRRFRELFQESPSDFRANFRRGHGRPGYPAERSTRYETIFDDNADSVSRAIAKIKGIMGRTN